MTDPRRESPTAWLWAEIVQRLGTDEAEALRRAYLDRCASYHHARRHSPPSPAEQRRPGPKAKQERRLR